MLSASVAGGHAWYELKLPGHAPVRLVYRSNPSGVGSNPGPVHTAEVPLVCDSHGQPKPSSRPNSLSYSFPPFQALQVPLVSDSHGHSTTKPCTTLTTLLSSSSHLGSIGQPHCTGWFIAITGFRTLVSVMRMDYANPLCCFQASADTHIWTTFFGQGRHPTGKLSKASPLAWLIHVGLRQALFLSKKVSCLFWFRPAFLFSNSVCCVFWFRTEFSSSARMRCLFWFGPAFSLVTSHLLGTSSQSVFRLGVSNSIGKLKEQSDALAVLEPVCPSKAGGHSWYELKLPGNVPVRLVYRSNPSGVGSNPGPVYSADVPLVLDSYGHTTNNPSITHSSYLGCNGQYKQGCPTCPTLRLPLSHSTYISCLLWLSPDINILFDLDPFFNPSTSITWPAKTHLFNSLSPQSTLVTHLNGLFCHLSSLANRGETSLNIFYLSNTMDDIGKVRKTASSSPDFGDSKNLLNQKLQNVKFCIWYKCTVVILTYHRLGAIAGAGALCGGGIELATLFLVQKVKANQGNLNKRCMAQADLASKVKNPKGFCVSRHEPYCCSVRACRKGMAAILYTNGSG